MAAVALAAAATPRIVGFMLSDSGVRGSRGWMRDLGAAARVVVQPFLLVRSYTRDGMEDQLRAGIARAGKWGTGAAEEELCQFLSRLRAALSRMPRPEVLHAFPLWCELVRALADSPIILCGRAAEFIVGLTLAVLAKITPDSVPDPALRTRCEDAQWWCVHYLRHLVGAAVTLPDIPFEAGLALREQRDAEARRLVQRLQHERDIGHGARAAAISLARSSTLPPAWCLPRTQRPVHSSASSIARFVSALLPAVCDCGTGSGCGAPFAASDAGGWDADQRDLRNRLDPPPLCTAANSDRNSLLPLLAELCRHMPDRDWPSCENADAYGERDLPRGACCVSTAQPLANELQSAPDVKRANGCGHHHSRSACELQQLQSRLLSCWAEASPVLLPFDARTAAELLVSCPCDLVAAKVDELISRLHARPGLRAQASFALMGPRAESIMHAYTPRGLKRAHNSGVADGSSDGNVVSGGNNAFGEARSEAESTNVGGVERHQKLLTASRRAWHTVLQQCPQLAGLATACVIDCAFRRDMVRGVWRRHIMYARSPTGAPAATSRHSSSALLLLRLLRRAMPTRACAGDGACGRLSEYPLGECALEGIGQRRLRSCLELERCGASIRTIHTELARLTQSTVHGMPANEVSWSQSARGASEYAVYKPGVEGARKHEALAAAIAENACMAYPLEADPSQGNAAEITSASHTFPCNYKASSPSVESLWCCVGEYFGWAQCAMVLLLQRLANGSAERLDAEGASGLPCRQIDNQMQRPRAEQLPACAELELVLWCACPTNRLSLSAAHPHDCFAQVRGTATGAASAASASKVQELRLWLCATLPEILSAARSHQATGLSREVEATSDTSLSRRVEAWQARDGAHSGLLWQAVLAATCIADNPYEWLMAAITTLLPAAAKGRAGPVHEHASSRHIEADLATWIMEWASIIALHTLDPTVKSEEESIVPRERPCTPPMETGKGSQHTLAAPQLARAVASAATFVAQQAGPLNDVEMHEHVTLLQSLMHSFGA